MKTPDITQKELETQIHRHKCTLANLRNSHAKQIRLMIGDFTPVVICDSIFSTAEFKKEYMRRLSYRIIELENKLNGALRTSEVSTSRM